MGVSGKVSKKELKKVYHQLSIEYHPDNSATGNEEFMQRINVAYSQLVSGDEYARTEMEAENRRYDSKTFEERFGEMDDQMSWEGPQGRQRMRDMWAEEDAADTYWDKFGSSPGDAWKDGKTNAERQTIRQAQIDKDAQLRRARRVTKHRQKFNDGNHVNTTHGGTGTECMAQMSQAGFAGDCVRRPDGVYVYFLRGQVYHSHMFVDPLDLQVLATRKNMDPEKIKRYGLELQGSARTHTDGEYAKWQRMWKDVNRSVPFLFDGQALPEPDASGRLSSGEQTVHGWRQKYARYIERAKSLRWKYFGTGEVYDMGVEKVVIVLVLFYFVAVRHSRKHEKDIAVTQQMALDEGALGYAQASRSRLGYLVDDLELRAMALNRQDRFYDRRDRLSAEAAAAAEELIEEEKGGAAVSAAV